MPCACGSGSLCSVVLLKARSVVTAIADGVCECLLDYASRSVISSARVAGTYSVRRIPHI